MCARAWLGVEVGYEILNPSFSVSYLQGELSGAVVSSVGLGQGDGEQDGVGEQKIQVCFCLHMDNHPADTAHGTGREVAGGAAGEEVNLEQGSGADMSRLKIKPGK